MKRKKLSLLLVLPLLAFVSCLSPQPPTSRRDVYLEGKIKEPASRTLLIFSFQTPSYAAPWAVRGAEIFHQEFLRANRLQKVVLDTDCPWTVEDRGEEASIQRAIAEASRRGVDLLLLGRWESLIFGRLTGHKAALRLRLIEVSTGKTLWYEQSVQEKRASDSSYPVETQLSAPPQELDATVRDLARKMVNDLFQDSKVQSFLRFWEKK